MFKPESQGMKNPTVVITLFKDNWKGDTVELIRYMYDALYSPLPNIGERVDFRGKGSFKVTIITHCFDSNEIRIIVKKNT